MMKRCTFFFAFLLAASGFALGTESEYFRKGLSYYQRGEFTLAGAHFEEARRTDPRNPYIYFYLGNVYYQQKDLDRAIVNFTAGLDLAERKGPFFYNLGNCYYLKENYDFSAEMYSKAVDLDPGLRDSYLNAGNAYYRMGDYANTIVQWETYLAVYPETPQYANIEKAIAYLKEGLAGQTPAGAAAGSAADQSDLLDSVMADLEELLGKTENVMEVSEKPVDDLTKEEIER